LGRQYDRNPDDKPVAMNYARALRGMSEDAQAVAILQRLSIKFPRDVEVLAAYGKALAEAGRSREAAEVLAHAHTPERPNWSVLSAHRSRMFCPISGFPARYQKNCRRPKKR
jgi:Flp pilus assembly protein TadD